MGDLKVLYLDSCSSAVDLIAHSEVSHQWSLPSVLPELSVGGLAAHLGRALFTVDAYLQSDAPAGDGVRVDAAGYLVAALGDHDPVTSDFHHGVRQRGESAAEGGQQRVVESLREVIERLHEMPDDMDRQITVLAGLQMKLGEYLKTRLIEIAVHGRDLADSVGVGPPAVSQECWQVVSEVVVAVTVMRNEPAAVALALSRADRFPRVVAF